MDMQTKQLIASRAKRLFPFVHNYLRYEDEADPSFGAAFKFAWLLLKGPRDYLRTFGSGELMIDADLVDDLYFQYRHELPGRPGLMNEEKIIVRDHNFEVKKYLETTGTMRPRLQIVGLR